MAAAIPAAIGVGSSLIGSISGKGAAKKQQQLAEQQRRDLLPLIQAQILASQFGLGQAQSLFPVAESMLGETFSSARKGFNKGFEDYEGLLGDARTRSAGLFDKGNALLDDATPYLKGAGQALADLQRFYRPFMFDGQSAIDRFLPSASRVNQMLAPEMGNINQGFQSASENIEKFAPRGGGRISSLAKADLDRQKGLSDVFFQGRENLGNKALGAAFQGAQGQQGVAQLLQSLGLGQGQLGLGTISAGNQTLGTGGGLAMNAMANALNALGIGGGAAGNMSQLATSALGLGLGGGSQAYNMYNQQADRAYGGRGGGVSSGQGLGGYLVDLFSNKSIQDKIGGIFGGGKNKSLFLTEPYNPYGNQTRDFDFFA